ncbi:MAG: hypothetical protein A2087_14095 [Spirochaetes bacterium GWD1_61_31]|nr:MAG: hypothetical protein A2Y37_02045 [Spirochaetes bacterium GWB1_60_80]OHD39576.1 MAG: hypothetical protein A2087_14095 [Spirochaetes bacterium GWD1_61_31]OHD43848.1 MAG: hypothetical protein A2Y35_00365 [Spirochaetes bacterium GWE1_60_18]HAP44278.1 hypothetical protein [Spirochaetaceae bacterium]HBO39996.1 hypothetical protein [Spirochaetaceae bacterium]
MIYLTAHADPIIVAETPDWLVAAKPAAWHCAPTAGRPATPALLVDTAAAGIMADADAVVSVARPTLCDWLFSIYPEVAAINGFAPGEGGLLHRLDAATSGLVLFARTQTAFDRLRLSSAAGHFAKEYLAACDLSATGGALAGLDGCRPPLNWPAGVDESDWPGLLRRAEPARLAAALSATSLIGVFRPFGPAARQVACARLPLPAGKAARNWGSRHYRTDILRARPAWLVAGGELDSLTLNLSDADVPAGTRPALLCRVRLSKGFRHQIRAHLAWLGLPLLGDQLYNPAAGDLPTTPRLGLHAGRLTFPDPSTGQERNVVDSAWLAAFDEPDNPTPKPA